MTRNFANQTPDAPWTRFPTNSPTHHSPLAEMKTGSGPVSHRQFHISIKVVGANHARAAEPGAGAKTRLRMPPQNGVRSSSEDGMWRMPANDANLRELNPGRSLDSLPHQLTNSPTHHSPLTTHHSPLTTHHSPLTTRNYLFRGLPGFLIVDSSPRARVVCSTQPGLP